jgi:hypothetical protein
MSTFEGCRALDIVFNFGRYQGNVRAEGFGSQAKFNELFIELLATNSASVAAWGD